MTPLAHGRSNEQGLALVAVLWGIALLSLMIVGALSLERASRFSSDDTSQRAREEALAEGGINRAILALLDPNPARRWRIDGIPRDFAMAGGTVRISIQDESGKIDLNAADHPLLSGLFVSGGLSSQAADELADKVMDWREPGDLHRLNGAKEPEYRAAGYPYVPRNGPLQSIDELKLVMGMTPELYQRIEAALTIYSQRPSINVDTAPREALMALPTFDAENADAFVKARSGAFLDGSPTAEAGQAGSSELPSGTQPLSLVGIAFSIRAEPLVDGLPVLAREAVIRISGDAHRPYWILWWGDRPV